MADEHRGTQPVTPAPADAAQSTIARQAAEIARLRARLADAPLAEELRQALTVVAAAGAIAAPVSHRRLLEMIVAAAAQVIAARAASLYLIDEAAQELIFEVALGPEAAAVKKFRVPLGTGIAGLVALSGQPMAIADAAHDPRQAADIARSVGYTPNSVLCVPLFYNEAIIGVLQLLDKEGSSSFSAGDMATLGLFATQAAVAIEQSRIHSHLTALVAEVLESLGSVAAARKPALQQRLRRFAGTVEEDPAYGRALALARLVQEIAWRGESEAQLCRTVLEGFATYARAQGAAAGASASDPPAAAGAPPGAAGIDWGPEPDAAPGLE